MHARLQARAHTHTRTHAHTHTHAHTTGKAHESLQTVEQRLVDNAHLEFSQLIAASRSQELAVKESAALKAREENRDRAKQVASKVHAVSGAQPDTICVAQKQVDTILAVEAAHGDKDGIARDIRTPTPLPSRSQTPLTMV